MGIVRRCPRNIFSIRALASKRRFSFDDGAFGDCSFGPEFWSKHPVPFFLRATSLLLAHVLVLVFGVRGTIVAAILSMRGFVWIGLISYSAYLWHQPLFAFARIEFIQPVSSLFMLVMCIVTLPLAYLSWRFVEVPWRSKAQRGMLSISHYPVCNCSDRRGCIDVTQCYYLFYQWSASAYSRRGARDCKRYRRYWPTS